MSDQHEEVFDIIRKFDPNWAVDAFGLATAICEYFASGGTTGAQ